MIGFVRRSIGFWRRCRGCCIFILAFIITRPGSLRDALYDSLYHPLRFVRMR